MAHERARRREESLQATEARLETLAAAVRCEQEPLRGAGQIGLRVEMAVHPCKVAKHFKLRIGDGEFSYVRKSATIAAEAVLDGLYAIRTSLAAEDLQAQEVVRTYQELGRIEQIFGSCQTADQSERPHDDRSAARLRAQAPLCMLAYCVEWHMQAKLAPLLSADHDPSTSEAQRSSLSSQGEAKGRSTHSFRSLLEGLSTIACSRIEPQLEGVQPFELLTRPTELQRETFDLLGVELE